MAEGFRKENLIPSASGGGLSEDADAKIKSLQVLHGQKTRALMRSIEQLRKEVKVLQSQAKESRRSEMIQKLKVEVREQELVCDVLKKELAQASGLSAVDVDELVMKKTLGGPKRFRPKTREELTAEVRKLTVQLKRQDGLRKRRGSGGDMHGEAKVQAVDTPETLTETSGHAAAASVGELQEEMDVIRVELEAARKSQEGYKAKVAQLEEELAAGNQFEEKFTRLSDKYAKLKSLLQQQEELELEGQRKVVVLEEENARVISELQILKDQLARKERGLHKGEHEKIEVTRRASLREQELVQQIDQLKRDVAASKQETFEKDKAVSEDQLRATAVLTERLAVLEQRAASSTDENHMLRKKVSEQESMIKELTSKNLDTVSAMKQQLDETKNALNQAKQRCADLQKEKEDYRLQAEEAAKFENAPQDEAFASSETSQDSDEDERIDILENDIVELKKKNEELNTQNERNAEYLKQLSKLQEEQETASSTHDEYDIEHGEIQQALIATNAEKRALQLALRKSKSYIRRLELERSFAESSPLTSRVKLLETQEITLKSATEQLMGQISLLLVQLEKHNIPVPQLPSLSEIVASLGKVSSSVVVEEKEGSSFNLEDVGDETVPKDHEGNEDKSESESLWETDSSSSDDDNVSDVENLNSSEESEDDDSRLYSLDGGPQESKH